MFPGPLLAMVPDIQGAFNKCTDKEESQVVLLSFTVNKTGPGRDPTAFCPYFCVKSTKENRATPKGLPGPPPSPPPLLLQGHCRVMTQPQKQISFPGKRSYGQKGNKWQSIHYNYSIYNISDIVLPEQLFESHSISTILLKMKKRRHKEPSGMPRT